MRILLSLHKYNFDMGLSRAAIGECREGTWWHHLVIGIPATGAWPESPQKEEIDPARDRHGTRAEGRRKGHARKGLDYVKLGEAQAAAGRLTRLAIGGQALWRSTRPDRFSR